MDYKEKLHVLICTDEGDACDDELPDDEELEAFDYAFTEGWLTAAQIAVLNSQEIFMDIRDAIEVLYGGVADPEHSEEFIDVLTRLCLAEVPEEDEPEPEPQILQKAGRPRKSAWEETTIDLGKRGEDAAARCLEVKGYTILERNWRCDFGEADIIAKDEKGTVVFIEVKTRRGSNAGVPEEAITKSKRKKYERIALEYLSESDCEDGTPIRFDAIGICVKSPNHAVLRHHVGFFDVGD